MNGTMKDLPECLLLATLAAKANDRHDIKFDFSGKLNDFCQHVSKEVAPHLSVELGIYCEKLEK